MITRDMVGGAAAALIGGTYLFYASQLRPSSLADSFGPQGMPLVYGWLMLGLGLVLLAQSLLSMLRLDKRERAAAQNMAWSGQGRKILWAAGLLAFAFAYLLVVQTLGYLPSMALLLVGVSLFLGANLTWRPLVIGIGGAVVLWLIFVKLLAVPMPRGILSIPGL